MWALVSTLDLTGCVTLAKSLLSLGTDLYIYKTSGLEPDGFEDLFQL